MKNNFTNRLEKMLNDLSTPAFIFDLDELKNRLSALRNSFNDIPISFSIKANPFLVPYICDEVDYLEVCSPGELEICIKNNVPPNQIIYSGVNKGKQDITRAMEYGAAIITAESLLHFETARELSIKSGKKQDVILRLSSGNQFGMSAEDIYSIFSSSADNSCINIKGIHYFSGTQKNLKSITKDLQKLEAFLVSLKEKFDYMPELVEYGTGLKTEYYNDACEETDLQLLSEVSALINDFSKKYPIGLEFGRFIAASCGSYITTVCDIKNTGDGNYVICDGGINQLVYYGQNMAMKIPPVYVLNKEADTFENYCLCGSLCTVADVLVRNIELPKLEIGDVIAFGKCGAYSVTEGTALFLTRQLPAVYAISKDAGLIKIRSCTDTYNINS